MCVSFLVCSWTPTNEFELRFSGKFPSLAQKGYHMSLHPYVWWGQYPSSKATWCQWVCVPVCSLAPLKRLPLKSWYFEENSPWSAECRCSRLRKLPVSANRLPMGTSKTFFTLNSHQYESYTQKLSKTTTSWLIDSIRQTNFEKCIRFCNKASRNHYNFLGYGH